MYKRQISKCLKYSSLGLCWNLSNRSENKPYLCQADTKMLIEEAIDAFEQGHPFDSYEVIDRAFEIRKLRVSAGIKFLNLTGSETYAAELLQKVSKPPSRPWIHSLLSRTHMQLRDRRKIKLQRITGCRREVFEEYFHLIAPIITQTSPYLIFGAYETMLETLLGTKVLFPEDATEALAAEVESFPHISVMCYHSLLGEVMPPYMIIPSIRTLPPELKIFSDSGLIDVVCAPSGYMNKDAFLF